MPGGLPDQLTRCLLIALKVLVHREHHLKREVFTLQVEILFVGFPGEGPENGFIEQLFLAELVIGEKVMYRQRYTYRYEVRVYFSSSIVPNQVSLSGAARRL